MGRFTLKNNSWGEDMLKKYLVLLIMFFICYNSYGKLNSNVLREKRIVSEIDFQNITLGEALAIISKDTGVSFIPDSEVKEIPLELYFPAGENMETLINTLLEINHLKLSSIGDLFVVSKNTAPIGDYTVFGKIKQKGYDHGLDGVKITLTNSSVPPAYSGYGGKFILPDVEPGVYITRFEKNGYKSKGELINIKDKSTSILVEMEKDNNLKNHAKKSVPHEEIISTQGDIVTEKVILNNSDCSEMQKVLVENYGNSLKVSSISKQNILILSGDRPTLKNAMALVSEIDNNIQQILISSQILDVSNNVFEELGFNWNYTRDITGRDEHNSPTYDKAEDENRNSLHIGLLDTAGISGIGNVYNSSINVVRQFNRGSDVLNLGINMLEATQDLVVSARPSILVVNGEEGEFKVTEEVIVGEEKNENESNDRVTYTPIFKEAGIIFKVTPQIKEDGVIILKLLIEVSNFRLKYNNEKNETGGGTFNAEGGAKIARSIKTTIKMKDGQTVFIGGLKKAKIHNNDNKIPFFGTLPMIDFFFKNQGVSHEISDIYIKLKVDIVDDRTCEFEKDEIHNRVKNIVNNRIY